MRLLFQISTHIKEECPLTIISCPYEHIGCTAKVTQKNEGDQYSGKLLLSELLCLFSFKGRSLFPTVQWGKQIHAKGHRNVCVQQMPHPGVQGIYFHDKNFLFFFFNNKVNQTGPL